MMKRTLPLFLLAIALIASTLSAGSTSATVRPFQDVKAVFAQKCASCHALDGSGNTAKGKELKIKDMRSAEVQKMSDAQLYDVTAKGKGKMPGYEKSLGKDKVNQLVAYVRQLKK